MATDGSPSREIASITRICQQTVDTRALRLSLLEEIRRVVPFDAYAWLLTDPETQVGNAPVADVPVRELPGLIRLKYLTSVNRWTALEGAVGFLSTATEGELERSLIWRDLLRNHGVHDMASIVFRDRFGSWAFLDLWRITAPRPFDRSDAEFLEAVVPPITEALRRSTAATFDLQPRPTSAKEPVVLMLTPDLEVKGQTAATEGYLRVLIPTEEGRQPVPAAAYNVGAQLIALETGIDSHPAMSRVHLRDGAWLTLRAARIGDGTTSEDADIAVTIERSRPGERLQVFARAAGLSPRETELLQHLAAGAGTRGIAQAMFVSEHTVQDHLKAIFEKTGRRSRNALLAMATGLDSD
jgi:DNA-binding NarL/FixJ family response regulator